MSWFNLVFGITSIASQATYESETDSETDTVTDETQHESDEESYGIKIRNPVGFSEDFAVRIIEALELLARYCPEQFNSIQQYTHCISSATTSGAAYWENKINIGQQTFDQPIEWLASVLVHEHHHILRRSIGDKDIANSAEEELDCIEQQMRCLKQLNAPQYLINGLRSQ